MQVQLLLDKNETYNDLNVLVDDYSDNLLVLEGCSRLLKPEYTCMYME